MLAESPTSATTDGIVDFDLEMPHYAFDLAVAERTQAIMHILLSH